MMKNSKKVWENFSEDIGCMGSLTAHNHKSWDYFPIEHDDVIDDMIGYDSRRWCRLVSPFGPFSAKRICTSHRKD
jgi:hypothetical protein